MVQIQNNPGTVQAEEKKFTIEKVVNLVSRVAPLIQSIFGGKKAKEALAQKGQYDQANAALRSEISTLNATINDLTQQSNTIAIQLKAKGINGFDCFESYSGMDGLFDFLRPKKMAEKKLNSAKETYDALSLERDQKLTEVANIIDQLDTLKKKLEILEIHRRDVAADMKDAAADMKSGWNDFKSKVNKTLNDIDRDMKN